MRSGLFIPDPDFLPIPDPGVKMAPDPGFATSTNVYVLHQSHTDLNLTGHSPFIAKKAGLALKNPPKKAQKKTT
jgi:hypothetical protein